MKILFRLVLLALVVCLASSCAVKETTGPAAEPVVKAIPKTAAEPALTSATAPRAVDEEKEVRLWQPCSLRDAESLAKSSEDTDLLQSAACYAALFENKTIDDSRHAEAGRKVIVTYLEKNPGSGIGHYLHAYLVGKQAQFSPLNGLDLVPVLEQEALLALRLSPEVDSAGPDRMLGELYLQAPSAPVSLGSITKSLKFFAEAVKIAPDFYLNHLGYGAALLEDDEKSEACVQYTTALKSKNFNKESLKEDFYHKLVSACEEAPVAKKS
jgi:tetratricopeptide (TPR) repeat protein